MKKPVVRPPRDPLQLVIWLRSGPGRAWFWQQWARTIKPDTPLYPVAADAKRRLDDVLRYYEKEGAADYATTLLDGLTGELRGRLAERHRTRSAGGNTTAIQLKREARERDKELATAAAELGTTNPRLSNAAIASMLSDRRGGSAEVIRRKLGRLRPRKKLG